MAHRPGKSWYNGTSTRKIRGGGPGWRARGGGPGVVIFLAAGVRG